MIIQAGEPLGAGGMLLPLRQRLAAQERQAHRAEAAQLQGEGQVGGTEGSPGRPLDLQASLNELMGVLQRVLDYIPTGDGAGEDSDGYDSTSTSPEGRGSQDQEDT